MYSSIGGGEYTQPFISVFGYSDNFTIPEILKRQFLIHRSTSLADLDISINYMHINKSPKFGLLAAKSG